MSLSLCKFHQKGTCFRTLISTFPLTAHSGSHGIEQMPLECPGLMSHLKVWQFLLEFPTSQETQPPQPGPQTPALKTNEVWGKDGARTRVSRPAGLVLAELASGREGTVHTTSGRQARCVLWMVPLRGFMCRRASFSPLPVHCSSASMSMFGFTACAK